MKPSAVRKKIIPITDSVILLLILLASSCASPKITNLSRGKFEYKLYSPNRILDVSVAVLPNSVAEPKIISPLPEPYFTSFRDSLPHVYIKAVAAKAVSLSEFLDALKNPLHPVVLPTGNVQPSDVNHQRFTIRWLFSSVKKYYNNPECLHPNTRLEFLNSTLILNDLNGLEIYSIDRIENELEEIDLGTLERISESTFNAGVEGSFGGHAVNTRTYAKNSSGDEVSGTQEGQSVYDENGNLIGQIGKSGELKNNTSSGEEGSSELKVGAEVSGNASINLRNNFTEAMNLKFKRLKTGFAFRPHSLTIAQRGAPMMEIYDNVIVTSTLKAADDITRRTPSYRFTKTYNSQRMYFPIDSVNVQRKSYNYVPCSIVTDIQPTLQFEGALRVVENNKRSRNILEYDDDVTYYIFKDTLRNIDISKYSFCEDAYYFRLKLKADGSEYDLRVSSDSFDDRLIVHEDDDPAAVWRWLTHVLSQTDPALLRSEKFSIYYEVGENKMFLVKDGGIEPSQFDILKGAEIMMYFEE